MASIEAQITPKVVRSVLQHLRKKNPVCTWIVSDGKDEKIIYFSAGGVRVYSSEGRRVSLDEDYLVRRKIVTREQMDLALRKGGEKRDEKGKGVAELLATTGVITTEQYQAVIEDVVVQELCDVVMWDDALCEFYEDKPPREIYEAGCGALSAAVDLARIADRVQEWIHDWMQLKPRLGSARILPIVLPEEGHLRQSRDLSLHLGHLLAFINGRRSLHQLSRASGLTVLEVAHAVAEGLEQGFVRAAGPVDGVGATGQTEELREIEALEQGLDEAIHKVLVHKCIIQRLERLGESFGVSNHLLAIGNLYVEAAQVPRAVESYRRAVKVYPTNLAAHENLIAAMRQSGDVEAAHDEALVLAKKLVAYGSLDGAVKHLRKSLRQADHRQDLRTYLAEVLVEQKKTSEAVVEYLEIARLKKEKGYYTGLEEVYRKALSLDPRSRSARAGLKQEQQRRVGRKIIWLHRLSAAVAILALIAWGTSEFLAREAWAQSRDTVLVGASRGSAAKALDRLRDIGGKFPGNLLASELVDLEGDLFRTLFHTLEDRIDEAIRLSSEARCVEAIDVLENVVQRSLVESQRRRAEELLEGIENFRDSWLRMRNRAERLLEANFRKEAFAICRQMMDTYPEGAQGLKVPFLIRSSTPGARVRVDDVLWGYSPLWIVVEYGRKQKVEVEIPGYPPQILDKLTDRDTPFVNVDFRRRRQ